MKAKIAELEALQGSDAEKKIDDSSSGYVPTSSDEERDDAEKEKDTMDEERDDTKEEEVAKEKGDEDEKDAAEKSQVGFRVRAEFSKQNLKRWTQTFVKYPLNISGQSPYSEALEKLRAKKQSTIDEIVSTMTTTIPENTTPTAHAQQQVDGAAPVITPPLKRLRTKSSY